MKSKKKKNDEQWPRAYMINEEVFISTIKIAQNIQNEEEEEGKKCATTF